MQKGKAAQLWPAIERELPKSFYNASLVSNRGRRTIGFVINTKGAKFTFRGNSMPTCLSASWQNPLDVMLVQPG